MPLKALIDKTEIIASFLTTQEWVLLKDRIKKENIDVIISQTGKKGYLRTSKNGLNHFAHKKGQSPENWKSESQQHLLAKSEILKGCNDAGWKSNPEVNQNNWIADVLAEKDNKKIAFEVQWSPQSAEGTEIRQNKYELDNVRACWFFKKLPKEYRAYNEQAIAKNSIPLFKIKENISKEIVVEHGSNEHSIRDFTKALLNGQMKFRSHLTAKRNQEIEITFFETTCWKCGEGQHLYFLPDFIKSKCGNNIYHSQSMWDGKKLELQPFVIQEIQTFLKTKSGEHLKIGVITPRRSNTVQRTYVSFGCIKCDALFGDWYVRSAIIEEHCNENNLTVPLKITFPNDYRTEHEHWCFKRDYDFC